MSRYDQKSSAQFVEKFMHRLALSIFIVSVIYAIRATSLVMTEEVAIVLNQVTTGLSIVMVLVLLPTLLKYFYLKKKWQPGECSPDGFVLDVYKRSAEKAFGFTFITLIIMDVGTEFILTDLPPEFYLKIVCAVSLAIFSVTFFILNRTDDNDFNDDFEDDKFEGGTNS